MQMSQAYHDGYRAFMLGGPANEPTEAFARADWIKGVRDATNDLADAENRIQELAACGTKLPAGSPRCVVEYARRTPTLWEKLDITPYYEECRAGYPQRAGVFVGD